jgi:predicted secreted Zn-dependent protease
MGTDARKDILRLLARPWSLGLVYLAALPALADPALMLTAYPQVSVQDRIQTRYYPVSGSTYEAIMKSLAANGPAVVRGGITVADTRARLGFSSEYRASPTLCALSNAKLSLSLLVSLPRHTAPQSMEPGLRRRWQDFVGHVTAHEWRHVAIYRTGVLRAKQAFERLDSQPHCELLAQQMKSLWALAQQSIAKENQAFEQAEANFRGSAAKLLRRGPGK